MKGTMRWIATAFGILVFLVLVLIGIGTALPVRHVATCSVDLSAPTASVWKTVYDVQRADWRSNVARVDMAGPAPGANAGDRWTETDKSGHSLTYERISAEVDHRLVTRIADQRAPFGGTWTYDFTPSPNGTQLSITEDGQIYNPVFRLVGRYVTGYTATMRTYLTDLGHHFGTSPSVDCTDITPH